MSQRNVTRVLMALTTLCFGAIPATMLAYFAFLGALSALDGISVQDGGYLADTLLILGFLLGVAGTIGLWIAVFRSRPPVWMLIAGLMGVACGLLSLMLIRSLEETGAWFYALFALPATVAIAHIFSAWSTRGRPQ